MAENAVFTLQRRHSTSCPFARNTRKTPPTRGRTDHFSNVLVDRKNYTVVVAYLKFLNLALLLSIHICFGSRYATTFIPAVAMAQSFPILSVDFAVLPQPKMSARC